ncbi:hypothetical protein STEG23_016072 [Scotinomys teguina]
MCLLSWFLDPGGWSKTDVFGLYFIFPGICTLSLMETFTASQDPPIKFEKLCRAAVLWERNDSLQCNAICDSLNDNGSSGLMYLNIWSPSCQNNLERTNRRLWTQLIGSGLVKEEKDEEEEEGRRKRRKERERERKKERKKGRKEEKKKEKRKEEMKFHGAVRKILEEAVRSKIAQCDSEHQ